MFYDVHIPAGITPAASQTSYLAFKHVRLTSLDKKMPRRTFIPFAATNSAIESQVVMIKSPKIQTT